MIRAWAVVTGVLGILAAGAGVGGLIAKPDAVVWAKTSIDQPVVVIPPQVMAMDGLIQVVVDADPVMETFTGRPSDAYDWIRGETSAVVHGVSSWEKVDVLVPGLYRYDGQEPSRDIWRSDYYVVGSAAFRPGDEPAGLVIVVASKDRTPLGDVAMELRRDPGFGWAWPAVSAGAIFAAASLILFALAWLDLRPSRAAAVEGEAATASDDDGARGSRKARKAVVESKAEAKADRKTDRKRKAEPKPESKADRKRKGEPKSKGAGAADEGETPDDAPRPGGRRARRAAREKAAEAASETTEGDAP